MRNSVKCVMAVAVLLAMVCAAGADPLPGRDFLKFSQKPMIATPIPDPTGLPGIYYGHDELSTAWSSALEDPLYAGVFMADDFADPFDGDIVHVKWWGSYMSPEDAAKRVNRFAIAFENDVPAGTPNDPYDFSHPDCSGTKHTQVSVRDVDGVLMPMEGTFTETLVPGSNPNEPVYEYNAELCCPFAQKANTVYWLKIVALVDQIPNDPSPQLEWGWHNRDYTKPLASKAPSITPGDRIQGWLDPAGTPNDPSDDVPIWHFQDDAVGGEVINIHVNDPCDVHMDQDHWVSTHPSMFAAHYVDFADGPQGISAYSKDLAFELYAVPEPGTLTLLALGALVLLARRRG
jgi:hypothetical protein